MSVGPMGVLTVFSANPKTIYAKTNASWNLTL
jgi:hypothetical protein